MTRRELVKGPGRGHLSTSPPTPCCAVHANVHACECIILPVSPSGPVRVISFSLSLGPFSVARQINLTLPPAFRKHVIRSHACVSAMAAVWRHRPTPAQKRGRPPSAGSGVETGERWYGARARPHAIVGILTGEDHRAIRAGQGNNRRPWPRLVGG